MPNRNSKPLGAKEGCRFTFAVVTLSVVMLGLAISPTFADEPLIFLLYVYYAPGLVPMLSLKVPMGLGLILAQAFALVYPVAWTYLAYRGRTGGTHCRITGVVFCVHYGMAFVALARPEAFDHVTDWPVHMVVGMIVFAAWQFVLLRWFLRGYFQIGPGPQP